MILLIQYTVVFTSVLMLVALGGCFSEHSGVINIGLEGIMVFGALGGALVMRYLPDGTMGVVVVMACVLAAMLAGAIYSLLLAVAAINFKADQTLVGTAMNLLGTAAATVLVKAVNTAADPNNPSATIAYGSKRGAFQIVSGMEFSWLAVLAVILLVLSYFLLYKTKFGLRLMSCGEHPQASASVGINVYKMRYAGVLMSGMLGGLGGLVYITAGVSEWKFENGVAGFGFLALAVMIFGGWKPFRIALAALLFGVFRSLSNVYHGLSGIEISIAIAICVALLALFAYKCYKDKKVNIPLMVVAVASVALPFLVVALEVTFPPELYNMLPYIISLIVLVIFSKNSAAPKAEGIPYDQGTR